MPNRLTGHKQLELPPTSKDKLDSLTKENKRRYIETSYWQSGWAR